MSGTGQDRLLLLVRVAPEVATKARRTRRRFQQRPRPLGPPVR